MTITQQEIIALAVEAGCVKMDWLEVNAAFMQRFANLAYQRGVRYEREACAKLVESEACGGSAFNSAANYMAGRIRARSAETKD